MPTSNCLLAETNDHVLTLTLNQPEKRNALSLEMLEVLRATLVQSCENKNVRVVVIAPNGSNLNNIRHEQLP